MYRQKENTAHKTVEQRQKLLKREQTIYSIYSNGLQNTPAGASKSYKGVSGFGLASMAAKNKTVEMCVSIQFYLYRLINLFILRGVLFNLLKY